MVIVVMGVAGSGKTTIGQKLAGALGCPFYDADDFHGADAKSKMNRGIALTDEDRQPWLGNLADEIKKWESKGGFSVLACSALKKSYRDLLSKAGLIRWVYLKGDKEVIRQRLAKRKDHFMNSGLLDSQFDTLEEPTESFVADISQEPGQIVEALVRQLREP